MEPSVPSSAIINYSREEKSKNGTFVEIFSKDGDIPGKRDQDYDA